MVRTVIYSSFIVNFPFFNFKVTIAVGRNTFSEPIVNIVQLYKLPLRVAKNNIFDGKLKLEVSGTYINKK